MTLNDSFWLLYNFIEVSVDVWNGGVIEKKKNESIHRLKHCSSSLGKGACDVLVLM